MEPMVTAQPTLLSAEEIEALAFVPLGPMPGVVHKVVWQDDASMAGVLKVDGGYRLGTHAHRVNHHHVWVLDGRATVLGTEIGSGAYVHIPSGVEHDIDATATDGCTVFYLYIRPAQSAGGVT